ncbi:GNAT family N-acetyltransferase [Peterkaempfera sp. SMS 1(5)a]|uniref:GNAT family N-acetyltransferase n=1 Tax=Peterkaempfera podocarpi TaxID=3232308 RepID=UPI00366E5B78
MHTVTPLSPEDFRCSLADLAHLLAEVVAEGSSLGFRTPFDRHAAEAWWRTRQPAVDDGSLSVWVARGAEGIAGTVSLALEGTPNGRHRGEVLKLMVDRGTRGQGLARKLLATAEEAAVRAGATLLLLDTETGSTADRLYAAAGWTRYGIVPDYAADPAGVLRDCSFFYKQLR